MFYQRSTARKLRTALIAFSTVLMVVLSGQALGQAGIDTGSVTGSVKDPSGALVPGAEVTLTNNATGVALTSVSTKVGAYTFPIVQVGTYSLQARAKGFKDFQINGIVVHLGNTVTEDVPLQVGAANQEVTVTSAAPLLQAQDASLGTTISSEAATELPLYGGSAGRSFMSLTTTVAGVQFSGNNDSTGTFYVHGQQNGAVDVRVNGADDNAEVFGGITIPPIPDTIQEMKVETGNNDADLGHSYGEVVNVVTKQGTNKFSGSMWEYNENDMYDANDYFNKRTQLSNHLPNRPGRLKENSFGAVVGGPVDIPHVYNGHNKTFFTVDFQYTYYNAVTTYTGTVPTATMQSSGFTNLVDTLNLSTVTKTDGLGRTFQQGTVLDPATTRAIPCGGVDPITGLTAICNSSEVGVITDPLINGGSKSAIVRDPYFQELGPPAGCPALAGTTIWTSTVAGGPVPASCFNQLPASRIDPNAVKLLKLFPQTYNNVGINPATGLNNSGTHSYVNNFTELLPVPILTKQYDVRLDHTFSDKDSAYLTVSHYNQTQQQAPPYPAPLEGGGNAPFWTTNPTYMVVVTETHVFNPHLINEYRMSDEHNWNTRMDAGAIDNTFNIPAEFGIQGIPQTTNNGGLPTFNTIGSSISQFGSRVNVTWQKVGAWQFSDGLTKIIGKHEWKFGGEYWWTYGNIAQLPYSRGNFSYGQYANVPASGDGGPGMADFLLTPTAANPTYLAAGGVSTAAAPLGGVNGYNGDNWNKSVYHAPYIAFYAVDNWKVTPSLTFNLGIRDDYFGPYYAAGGSSGEANFWMGGQDGNEASGSAYYVNAAGCATTMSAYFKGLLAYDNIPIICSPNNAVNKTPKFNWAPRLGVAYRITPRIVVRAGAGVAYGAFNSVGYGNTLGTNYPFRVSVQQGPQYSYRPQQVSNSGTGLTTATMENTFGIVDMTNANNAYLPIGSIYMFGKRYKYPTPYTETLNAAVQWQFTKHDSIEARYVGVLGRQLENLGTYHNAARQALPPSVAAETPCAAGSSQYCENSPLMPDGSTTIPFPNLAPSSAMQDTEEISNYHSGEAEYIHQFAGGFSMDANYVYARCLSDAQAGEQATGGPSNGRAPHIVGFGGYRADYDRCTNEANQVFKLSGEYSLPFGKGALLAGNANGWENAIIGGWKINPIWIAESGTLVNVTCQGTVGGNPSNAGFTGPWFQTSGTSWNCFAPMVSGVNPYKPGSGDLPRTKVTGYFNSSAFTAPAYAVTSVGSQDFTPFGARGNQIYGPGWYDVDMSLHKQFPMYKESKFELAVMAINAFNHVHLNNPSTSGYTKPNETVTSGWGTITGDASNNNSGRILQFEGKIFF